MLTGMLCVAEVKRRTGILEQPAWSRLFTVAGLPLPNQSGSSAQSWSIEIDQFHFGHRVSKRTWLWFFGIKPSQLPQLAFTLRSDPSRKLDGITPGQRSQTPPAFASFLCQTILGDSA